VFAVEVCGEDDYGSAVEREMADKRADYLAAGTLVVWDVDVLRERPVRVYRAGEPDRPTVYRSGDVAEAEPASSGWMMTVNDLLS
jgi:Uma2 family endonuclease